MNQHELDRTEGGEFETCPWLRCTFRRDSPDRTEVQPTVIPYYRNNAYG